jgi:DUF1009 family protein
VRRLGLIAGGGRLPVEIADDCRRAGRPLFVIRLKGMAAADLAAFEGADVGLAEFGKCLKALRAARCEAVCLAGYVAKPDFAALSPDLRGMQVLPGAIAAARKGDDALLRFLVAEFEKEGFAVEGADEVVAGLTLGEGPLGRLAPPPEQAGDIARALDAARAVGLRDAGQGAVVRDGVLLAEEGEAGTDAMLAELHHTAPPRRGVLAKAPKPIQELRVDLPTIGPATVEGAARAGLAGIVGEAGRLIVLERERTRALADELGLFIVGVAP